MKWYGLVLVGVACIAAILGYSAGQSIAYQLPTDQTVHYEQSKMSVRGEPLALAYTLPFSFSIEAHQESIDIKQKGETLSSVPFTALIQAEKLDIDTNDIREHISTTLLFAFATTGMLMMLFIVISRIASIAVHAMIFQYVLQLIGGQFPLRKMAQVLIHTTIVAETISALAFVIYRNSSVPLFEIALVGSTILVLQSLRRPSA